MSLQRFTELSKAQQHAVGELVNRLASLQLPDDFIETLVRRTGNDAEAIWRYLMNDSYSRAVDDWFKENGLLC
jgi:hypothetical protein